MSGNSLDGVLVLDKPGDMTSRLALNIVYARLRQRTAMGHAGTLDPMATGVLVACLGRTTRLIECIQDLPKIYEAEITFGASSTTDDAEGDITPTPPIDPPAESVFRALLGQFTGTIMQRPPNFSAVKIGGRRAHNMARSGMELKLAPRAVRIDSIELTSWQWPVARLVVHCGKGTYVRSIARELGQALGTGGHCTMIRRTAVGTFTIDRAVSMDALPEKITQEWLDAQGSAAP